MTTDGTRKNHMHPSQEAKDDQTYMNGWSEKWHAGEDLPEEKVSKSRLNGHKNCKVEKE